MLDAIKTSSLFDLEKTIAKPLLEQYEFPWQALSEIKDFILKLGKTLSPDEFYSPKENVWISKNAFVFESAYIQGPCIIDSGAEIRHCAFIRGNAIVGKGSVIGNSTELKNAIIFDYCQVPHFNYVGDSILGYHAHMGAGSITSNVKSDKSLVEIKKGDEKISTGLKKFGAILGDYVEVGCNSVLNPGTIVGRNTTIYPTSCVRGIVKADSIYKSAENIIVKSKIKD